MAVTGPVLICGVTWHLRLGRAAVLTPSPIESPGRTVVVQTLGRVGVRRCYPRVPSREFILVCDCNYFVVFLKVNSCGGVNLSVAAGGWRMCASPWVSRTEDEGGK